MHVQILQSWKYWVNLTISIFFIGQSYYFFIHPEDKFSVLLPSTIELIRADSLEQGTVSYQFGGSVPSDSTYLSMTFVVGSAKESDYLSFEKIAEFEKKCRCKIKDANRVDYSNFSGYKYSFERKDSDVIIYGLAIFSELSNDNALKSVVVMPRSCRTVFDK